VEGLEGQESGAVQAPLTWRRVGEDSQIRLCFDGEISVTVGG
jgi:hypothetical protein